MFEDIIFLLSSCVSPCLPFAVCDQLTYLLNEVDRTNSLCSMQYYVLLILLHRPFLPGLHRVANGPPRAAPIATPQHEDVHAPACSFAAENITHIFRAYRSHCTLVSVFPLSLRRTMPWSL